jgi:hypothetical protein
MTVSTVNAQQTGPAGAVLVDQFASSNSKGEITSVRKHVSDPVYGMSSTRGARHLLRNGLDYLNYGEYQRALKFLRETESRKDELNDAEKLMLRQCIEKAQRGLREASNVELPYALSDQARNRNGFNPAKPATRITGQNNRPNAPAHHKPMLNESITPKSTVSDLEDEGEPIRLAKSEEIVADRNSDNLVAPKLVWTGSDNFIDSHGSDRPRQFPEIAELPKPSQVLSNTAIQPPSTVEPVKASYVDPMQNKNITQTVADPETKLPPTTKTVSSDNLTALAHAETDDNTSVNMQERSMSDSPALALYPSLIPVTTPEADNLVPSQTSKGTRTESMERANQVLPSAMAATAVITNALADADELPPLPIDITETAIPPHSMVNPGTKVTQMTDPRATVQPVNDNLPPVVESLGHPATQSINAVTSSLPQYVAVQGSMTAPLSPRENTPTAMPDVKPEVLPPQVRYEEAEPLPPLPSQAKDTSVASPCSPETVLAWTRSEPDSQKVVTQVVLPSGNNEPINPPLNSTPNEQTSMRINKIAAHTNPDKDALDAQPSLPSAIRLPNSLSSPIDSIVPSRPPSPSTLRPELKREVETIARKQEDELLRRQQAQPSPPTHDAIISDLRAQTQLDISRAPSPAEARPIKAIPVPEDWVPLAPRTWLTQRKYWAAAATCHLPLYFQDPVLERYGHSIEQFVGPIGRYLTYPLDSPTQSTQRNQILQPLFSAGLFAFQVAALPYNAIVDPPWEAQYDLGYYRPSDVIPTDLYWLPLHGYGPPFHGSNY